MKVYTFLFICIYINDLYGSAITLSQKDQKNANENSKRVLGKATYYKNDDCVQVSLELPHIWASKEIKLMQQGSHKVLKINLDSRPSISLFPKEQQLLFDIHFNALSSALFAPQKDYCAHYDIFTDYSFKAK